MKTFSIRSIPNITVNDDSPDNIVGNGKNAGKFFLFRSSYEGHTSCLEKNQNCRQ